MPPPDSGGVEPVFGFLEVQAGRILGNTPQLDHPGGPVLRRKFEELGCVNMPQVFVPDVVDMTVRAIRGLIREGAELLAVTRGMSVDPDDLTPTSIQAAGGKVVTYGAPTFPGAMFLLASIDGVPVVGLPGCVMYARSSIFDLMVPRLVAGETVTREEIVAIGHGGLCAGCGECRYTLNGQESGFCFTCSKLFDCLFVCLSRPWPKKSQKSAHAEQW